MSPIKPTTLVLLSPTLASKAEPAQSGDSRQDNSSPVTDDCPADFLFAGEMSGIREELAPSVEQVTDGNTLLNRSPYIPQFIPMDTYQSFIAKFLLPKVTVNWSQAYPADQTLAALSAVPSKQKSPASQSVDQSAKSDSGYVKKSCLKQRDGSSEPSPVEGASKEKTVTFSSTNQIRFFWNLPPSVVLQTITPELMKSIILRYIKADLLSGEEAEKLTDHEKSSICSVEAQQFLRSYPITIAAFLKMNSERITD